MGDYQRIKINQTDKKTTNFQIVPKYIITYNSKDSGNLQNFEILIKDPLQNLAIFLLETY